MADLLIKGMDMPPRGVYSAEIGVLDEKTAVIVICTPIGEPQRGYQLVEVPTHGRLIDADKLLEKGINLSWSVQKWMSEVEIGLMPTIIEASNK